MAPKTEKIHHPSESPSRTTAQMEFETAQQHVFEDAGVDTRSRYLDLERPRVRIHVIEAGNLDSDEPPIVFLHGGAAFSATFAPLMAQFDDRRLVAFDRPGHGLSGDFVYTATNIRKAACDVVEGVLDELGIEKADVVGSSGGGYWGIVFALTHPNRVRRLILVGGVPTFPGTRPPMPLGLVTIPVVDRLLSRFLPPTEAAVVKQMESVGEGATIQRYPSMIQALVAHGRAARVAGRQFSEFNALMAVRWWRGESRLREEELRKLQPPVTFIWGERDFLGGPDDVRDTVDSIPNAELVAIDAGHIPYFGHPSECAEHIRGVNT